MEISSKFKEQQQQQQNQSPLNSPTTSTCSTTLTQHQNQPIPITRSDPNSPYPTTFVTADTSSFKQVVQMLTGSNNEPVPQSSSRVLPSPMNNNKKQGFKLYERRNSLKHMISPLSPRINNHNVHNNNNNNNNYCNNNEVLSPSFLDFPGLTLSPVTPLVLLEDPFNKSSASSEEAAEDRAIAERGFYLHPSPRDSKPKLLPLFPLSSPRMSGP